MNLVVEQNKVVYGILEYFYHHNHKKLVWIGWLRFTGNVDSETMSYHCVVGLGPGVGSPS